MVDETRGSGTSGIPDENEEPVHDSEALTPVEDELPEAPPVDIDERDDATTSGDAIALEGTKADDQPHRSRWNDTIDELVPLPKDEPYHDSDATAPDPYDASDQVDIHVPPATGDASDEVDDFSTSEEVDVDNAPAGQNPDHERESDEPTDAANTSQAFTATAAAVGTTTCPTCGKSTEALRFCGYCGGPLTENRREITGDTPVERLMSQAATIFEPLARWTRPGGVRSILALGGLLVLVSLLANSGAMALVIGSAILPAIILFWCRQSDVFENEPWYIVAGFSIGGVVVGALLGWLGAFTAERSWFDEGVLNFGAAGFGGQFAESAGSAPFVVWLVCGVLVPVAALAAIIAGPMLMRQAASLRNEVMDGLTLAAAVGGGYAVGSALVFVSPLFGQAGPSIDASAWTLTTIGITVLRPLVWTLTGGLLGAAAWRYLLSGRIMSTLISGPAGIAIPLLMTMLSLQLSTTGLWAEAAIGVVAAIVAAVLYHRTMADAIREDRRVLGNDDSRLVCPNCHRVTPAGQFCAHCGEQLTVPAEAEA